MTSGITDRGKTFFEWQMKSSFWDDRWKVPFRITGRRTDLEWQIHFWMTDGKFIFGWQVECLIQYGRYIALYRTAHLIISQHLTNSNARRLMLILHLLFFGSLTTNAGRHHSKSVQRYLNKKRHSSQTGLLACFLSINTSYGHDYSVHCPQTKPANPYS